jgi:hypothetical protein
MPGYSFYEGRGRLNGPLMIQEEISLPSYLSVTGCIQERRDHKSPGLCMGSQFIQGDNGKIKKLIISAGNPCPSPDKYPDRYCVPHLYDVLAEQAD